MPSILVVDHGCVIYCLVVKCFVTGACAFALSFLVASVLDILNMKGHAIALYLWKGC